MPQPARPNNRLSMNIEQFREYCLAKKGVKEAFPFDEVTLVLKVGGKMFALVSLDGENSVNLKCDPERAIELREEYDSITPGYHMSKKHWNTVLLNGSLKSKFIAEMVDDSYNLVVAGLTKKMREELNKL